MNIKDLQTGTYKPVVSTTTPKLNINNLPQGAVKPVTPTPTEEPGIIKSIGQSIIQPFERIGKTITDKVAPNLASPTGLLGNEIKPITSPQEFAGETIMGLSNFMGGGVVKEGARVATKSILKRAIPKIASVTKNVVVPGVKAGGVYGAGQSLERGDTIQEAIPNVAENAAYGGAGAVVLGVGLPAVAKPIVNTVRGALRRATPEGRIAVVIENRANELEAINNNYVNMRKSTSFTPDSRKSNINRVAETDVLVNSVDENGLIRTKETGGAIDQYKALKLDGKESVVRANLERNQETARITDIKKKLDNVIKTGNLPIDEAEKAKATNQVIVDALLREYPDGNVPLVRLHDEKIKVANFAYKNPDPSVRTKAKDIARGYKELVEDYSSFDVRAINKELAPIYEDIKFLQELDGKRVKGGKLSRNFAQISGNIIGGAVGNAVGGPYGAAIGAATGGELASKVRGVALSKTLGRAVNKEVPKNPVLEKAKELSTKTGGIYSKIRGNRNVMYNTANTTNNSAMPRSVPINKPQVKSDIPSKQTLRGFLKKEPVPVEPKKPELPGNQMIRDRMLKKAIDEQQKPVKSPYEPIVPDEKLPVIQAGGKTVSKFKKVDKALPTIQAGANRQAYGAVAGIQVDDEGNVTFDPKMALAGLAVGSLIKKGKMPKTGTKQKLYHGTNDIDWVKRGEQIRKSETSTLGNPGVFWTTDPKKALEWTPASGGAWKAQQSGKTSGVVELTNKKSDEFNLKKLTEGQYEDEYFKISPDVWENPSKYGLNKDQVHEGTIWRLVEEKLKKEGYDGVDFGGSGVLFDPTNIKTTLLEDISPLKTGREEKLARFMEAEKKGTKDLLKKVGEKATEVYKEAGNLTTKILKDLEGKSTVSKQYILDATNRGELKQQERDLIRGVLDGEGETVNVSDFAKKVQNELLPLELNVETAVKGKERVPQGRYESVSLPNEVRGNVKNYRENVWKSPIKTSAGDTHFSGQQHPNYFGHTRIEDMADEHTRRVIEVQSDLYQKGGLERERISSKGDVSMQEISQMEDEFAKFVSKEKNVPLKEATNLIDDGEIEMTPEDELGKKFIDMMDKKDEQRISKLQQYSNPTAHFRMVREEIKKAAYDGKTKLQFPTGETAMKIEGLGGTTTNWHDSTTMQTLDMAVGGLEVGNTIVRASNHGNDYWVITDLLGDGKFKAVPKDVYDGSRMKTSYYQGEKDVQKAIENSKESFDISRKIDTNNPIYKFYEKDLGRYLTNKYGAKTITDDKGVNWYEVAIDKKKHGLPVEAFALAPLSLKDNEESDDSYMFTTKKKFSGETIERAPVEKAKHNTLEIMKAIENNEATTTGDKYTFHKFSGDKRYGDDLGKYQITSARLREKSKDFIGRKVSDKEFLASPYLQELFIEKQIKWLADRGLSPKEILAVHRNGWGDLSREAIDKAMEVRKSYVDKAKNLTNALKTFKDKGEGFVLPNGEVYKQGKDGKYYKQI